jgi:hypothetical protein
VPVSKWKDDFAKLYAEATGRNIPVFAITTQLEEAQKQFAATTFGGIQVLKCDFTAIRTAARTNPCIFLLKQGTIVDKQSYRRMDKITSAVKSLPAINNNQ